MTVSYWSHGQVGNSWFTLDSMVDLSSSLCQRVPEGNSWFYSAFSGITLVTTQLLWSALGREIFERQATAASHTERFAATSGSVPKKRPTVWHKVTYGQHPPALMMRCHMSNTFAICQTVDHSLFAQPIPIIPSMSETSQMNILHLTGWKV